MLTPRPALYLPAPETIAEAERIAMELIAAVPPEAWWHLVRVVSRSPLPETRPLDGRG